MKSVYTFEVLENGHPEPLLTLDVELDGTVADAQAVADEKAQEAIGHVYPEVPWEQCTVLLQNVHVK